MRAAELERRLREAGYEPARAAVLALAAALSAPAAPSGARAILVTGAPGTGKTALAEAVARALGAPFVYGLLHSWSGPDDLMGGVDVAAAVAGAADHVRQPGVLALAAEASHRHERVVVCLDELDKAPEAAEALLLDWLQSGRVPVRPGHHLFTRLDRVLVVLTSNAVRPHTDALLRRVRRLHLEPLPDELLLRVLAARTRVPAGICRLCVAAADEVAAADARDGDPARPEDDARPAPERAVRREAADNAAGDEGDAAVRAIADRAASRGSLARPSRAPLDGSRYGRAPTAGALPETARPARGGSGRPDARIVSLLRRLVAALTGPRIGDATPRWDASALTREIVSRRLALQRAREREVPDPTVVLAVDVSGSCSAVAGTLSAQAEALATAVPRLVVLLHANGRGVELLAGREHDPARILRAARALEARGAAPWVALARAADAVGIVSLADWDPASAHASVVEAGTRLWWLDHYTHRAVGRVRDRTRRIAWRDRGFVRSPTRYLVGVGSTEQFRAAVRLLTTHRTAG